jgi:hypothetical protein
MPYTLATMHGCALCNNLRVMQFLRAEGCSWDELVCSAAAESGSFEMLRWAREHGCPWFDDDILQMAASSGNTALTAWVMQQPGVLRNSQAIFAAATHGHVAVCDYLFSKQLPLPAHNELACNTAAERGHTETLRWLHEHGCPGLPLIY